MQGRGATCTLVLLVDWLGCCNLALSWLTGWLTCGAVHRVEQNTSLCLLCPNEGGALKPCKPDPEFPQDKWAHVACALWQQQVAFGDPGTQWPPNAFATVRLVVGTQRA